MQMYAVLHDQSYDYFKNRPVKRKKPDVDWYPTLEDAVRGAEAFMVNASQWFGIPKADVPVRANMKVIKTYGNAAHVGPVKVLHIVE